MKSFLKYVLNFIGITVLTILAYTILISLYCRVSSDPIIFFGSVVIIAAIAAIEVLLLYKFREKVFGSFGDSVNKAFIKFACVLVTGSACLITLVYSIFGPVFIDRSISYHIAFYAAENQEIEADEIESLFGHDTFEKRMHDAQVAGVLEKTEDGTYVATGKAKFLYQMLMPLGRLTSSDITYEDMKGNVENAD